MARDCAFSRLFKMSVLSIKKRSSFGQCRDTISFPSANVFPLHPRKTVTFTFETKLHWPIPYEALTCH